MMSSDQLCYFPVIYKSLEQLYQRQKNIFWVPAEVDLSKDREDYRHCDDSMRTAIKHILCFFSQVDGIIVDTLDLKFKEGTRHIKECKHFYAAQTFMEVVHSEMYGLLIEAIMTGEEKVMAFDAIATMPCIGQIQQWYTKWMDNQPMEVMILTNAFLEGPFLSGLFAFIALLKGRNIFRGLCTANDFISRDEALHYEFGMELYRIYGKCVDQDTVKDLVTSGVNMVEVYLRAMIPDKVMNMTYTDVLAHVKCIADIMLEQCGHPSVYNVPDPMGMAAALVTLTPKYNFFENTSTIYTHATGSSFSFVDVEF